MAEISVDDVEAVAGRIRDRLRGIIGTRQQQLALAAATGIPFGTIRDWASGRTSPSADRLVILAHAAGLDPAVFLSDKAPREVREIEADAHTVRLPVMDVRAAAGEGALNENIVETGHLSMPREWLQRLGANMRTTECFRAAGFSMSPTIENNALLVVDRAQIAIPDKESVKRGLDRAGERRHREPDIFVFLQGNALRVKRLVRLEHEHLALISDNWREYPPEILDRYEAPRVKIIGKVVWWDNRL